MEFRTSLIDLDSLEVNAEDLPFSPQSKAAELEYLARTIVELGNLIRIPLVKQQGIDIYRLISGYFDYYAFLKARELNPELPDRIRVFIIDKNNSQSVLNQLEAIKKLEQVTLSPSITPEQSPQDLNQDLVFSNLAASIKDLETNLVNHIANSISQSQAEILSNFESKLPKPLLPLQAFNQLVDNNQAVDSNIYNLLLKKLAFLGSKKAKGIVDKIVEVKKKQPVEFKTFAELKSVLGKGKISAEKLLEIIDNWD